MFGRLLWAGTAENYRAKSIHVAKIGAVHLVIVVCNDLFIRVWGTSGECLFSSTFDQISNEQGPIVIKSRLSSSGDQLDVFLQVSNSIHRYALYEDNGKCMLDWCDTLSAPNHLKDFVIINEQVWVVVTEDEVDVVKVFEKTGPIASSSSWVEVNRPLPPTEYTPGPDDIASALLQSSRITPSALRSALSQISPDNIPDNITTKYIDNVLSHEAQVANVNIEQCIADFYQLVLQYNERALTVSGLVGGRGGDDLQMAPMVLRRNVLSIIRPLTSIEAVCSGLPMAQSGLNLGSEAGAFLTDIIPIFNRIIFTSGVMETFTEHIRSGNKPLAVARQLQTELDMLIEESGEGDVLKAEINQLRTIINAGDDNGRIGSVLGPILKNLLTQIEFSPLTKDSCCFDTEIDNDIASNNLVRLRFLAHSIRSVAYNMLNLSQLLLLMVGYIIRTENEADLTDLELELATIVNNFSVLEWICSARATWKQKLTKSDNYMSTLNFSAPTIFDGSRLADSTMTMGSLSSSTIFQPISTSEEHLLELWLSHVGEQQVKQLIEFVPNHIQVGSFGLM